jgi:hypothetical protein
MNEDKQNLPEVAKSTEMVAKAIFESYVKSKICDEGLKNMTWEQLKKLAEKPNLNVTLFERLKGRRPRNPALMVLKAAYDEADAAIDAMEHFRLMR